MSDDIRGIDDNSASAGHGEVVPGDVAARHACEGESFAWGKMGFLEADNVVGFGKVIQGGGDREAARESVGVGRVEGEAADVIREDGGDGERGVREGEGRSSRGGLSLPNTSRNNISAVTGRSISLTIVGKVEMVGVGGKRRGRRVQKKSGRVI